jgi:hypothetical protein
MTVALGTMQVPAPQDGDSIRRYETGTLPDGGLWTALTRVSNHDHTGGLNGKPISVSSIPDGSITTSKLDPSVLAPYALTDASKPFTGQVTMNADAIVRDHLYFGAKPAGVADATLQRTSAGALRVDTNLGVGVNPAAWGTDPRAIQVGLTGSMVGSATVTRLDLADNTYHDGTNRRAIIAGAGTFLRLAGATLEVDTMASVAAGAIQTPVTRMLMGTTGTLTLTPDAGQAAIAGAAGQNLLITTPGAVTFDPASIVGPNRDNAISCGYAGSGRWTVVYAVSGTINTSSREAKQDITPLDPAAALAAVLHTDPVVFDYKPPERGPEWYDLPDDPEQAEAVLYQRLTSAPLEEAARHQAGFVLQDATGQYQTDPLFETGEGQSNAANSVGVILAALHAIDARLTALETP